MKEYCPEIRALVLTTFDDEETIQKAVESGADGYILKEMDDDKVIASVKSVYAGMSIFGENVYRVMREQMQRNTNPVAASQKASASSLHFTNRELDVIRMVAQGYDNKEIASQLYLAKGTVRNQISKVLDKIGVKDRTQLAVYAVKNGLDE